MSTLTLNRNMNAGDFLFVALNDSSYKDWKDSQIVEREDINWNDSTEETFEDKVRKFFGV